MSDDSDIQNKSGKRRKRPLKSTSSSESLDSGSPLVVSKHSRKQLIAESGNVSTSSEDEEVATQPTLKRRVPRILSDYESGDSNDGDGVLTDSSESSSENEDNDKEQPDAEKTKLDGLVSDSSSDSDGQSEKCPICLAKFSSQEIGTPESCDHYFCAICIQEWAKNVNTCPVDRQPFTLVLVRSHLEGKVIRQIPVNVSVEVTDVDQDATFCEECGLSDREDRMLLCDSCDHGYHMECLNPPLDYVPIDEWYCPECAPLRQSRGNRGRARGQLREEQLNDEVWQPRHRPAPRLLPRTRQSERVRTSLRNRTRQQADHLQPSVSSGIESLEGEVIVQARQQARTRRTRKTKRRTKFRIKKIVTDDGIIEVLVKRKGKFKKRRKNRTLRSTPRSVKGRLASRLGMCNPRFTKQTIPETGNRQTFTNAPINHQRHQAGIPTLDIFGRRDQLDYFSGSDGDEEIGSMEGGVGMLSRVRVARPNDRLISLKKAAVVLTSTSLRRPLRTESLASPASGNLLDTILDSQTLWHSKKTEIKSSSDGSLKVILPKSTKNEIVKEDKIDVRKETAPVITTPMFPGGKVTSGAMKSDNSNRGGTNQGGGSDSSEQPREESNYQLSGLGGLGPVRYESSFNPGPLRGATPIKFRMNVPPRRPNIHSYPTDNIPPPPPLRLRAPLVEESFPSTNSPESSPARDEEEIDIYSDIEQESSNINETEDKGFGTLEPPPEPPFLMTMEPPPEPPALLMNLNDDASDDEPSGLVIDDLLTNDAYDPCADSDESSTEETPLSKPPDLPQALKERELVADYSSDSTPSYNPELPTYLNTAIIGPLPRPSHHSSEAEDNDEECPNFAMYSAASMNLAKRGLPALNLDIPIPPGLEDVNQTMDIDIPLPDPRSPQSSDKEDGDLDIPIPNEKDINDFDKGDGNLDIPIPTENDMGDFDKGDGNLDIPIPNETDINDFDKGDGNISDDGKQCAEATSISIRGEEEDHIDEQNESTVQENKDKSFTASDAEEYDEDDGDDENEDDDEEDAVADQGEDDNESEGDNSVPEDAEKKVRSGISKIKGSSEAGEDECSTQGDVLDLAIESEANLENNIPHEENGEQLKNNCAKSPLHLEESDNKMGDGGDKSDGLVDITDEEMSVYDGQDNNEMEKIDEEILKSVPSDNKCFTSLYSDDENSLGDGGRLIVSPDTLFNPPNPELHIQPPTLPGLEGLETEIISESEDVNFDELPLEGNEPPENIFSEEDHGSIRKKKKKKYRKISHTEDTNKGGNEILEFEEGEIVDDKPKQLPKKDKKPKPKPDTVVEAKANNSEQLKTIQRQLKTISPVEKDLGEKKIKKKKEKGTAIKDKSEKAKDLKEKTLRPGPADENISWKKVSKSNKERHYRDGKEKEEREREYFNRQEFFLSKKDKRNKEKRKELERYNVRRLISEKPKRPKKDEFGRDISPSKSGSSLSPYRPPRYRSPLRTRNRSRTRSRSWKSKSRSRERKRGSKSRGRVRSPEKSKRTRSREKVRSRSRNKVLSRSGERRKSLDKGNKSKTTKRSLSKSRRKSRSLSTHSRRRRSLSYSKSWTPSWSRSSMSKSQSPRRGRRRSRSVSRSKSRSWTRDQNAPSMRSARAKDPPKNLTVIVTNKEALKKKEKKKPLKKKDDRRKRKRGQSPTHSKEVFTSGDNILVSVNFKNANKNPEIIPASTPLLRESSKRKRDDIDGPARKRKNNSSTKKTPGAKKSNRLEKINEVTRNAKPVAIIDLDLSPFREQTPSPKEVIVLSDSENEGGMQRSEMQDERDRMGHNGINQSMLSLSSIDHEQKNSMSQPESPLSTSFMLNSSGPKTPPEPHIKFSIATKPSQMRLLSNPLIEEAEEEIQDENIEDEDEILHKGPNTPPEPPPDLNTPASPPTTPYDPFDPTKSRSPSPQPRSSEGGSQINTSREDKLDNLQSDDNDLPHLAELSTTPPNELEDLKKTPEPAKVHSTPKIDHNNSDISPKVSPPTGTEINKLSDEALTKPMQKLPSSNKLDVTIHKSPEKLVTVVISQQAKNTNQTPKQPIQPLKTITPNKHQTPKSIPKHQLFSSAMIKQVPILGTLPLLASAPPYTPSMSLNSSSKAGIRAQQNGDPSDDMDIDPSSPYSPGSSEGDDLFEPPISTPPKNSSKSMTNKIKPSSANKFDTLFGSPPAKPRHGKHSSKTAKKGSKPKSKGVKKEEVKVKLDEDQLRILDELPSSAVEMQVKDKFLKKLNRQERVVEEVKLVLKPHYTKKHVNKEEYKEILRRAVPKICHNKSGEINPIKIQFLIEAYVKKFRYAKKKASGTLPLPGQNKPKPQKALWS